MARRQEYEKKINPEDINQIEFETNLYKSFINMFWQ